MRLCSSLDEWGQHDTGGSQRLGDILKLYLTGFAVNVKSGIVADMTVAPLRP